MSNQDKIKETARKMLSEFDTLEINQSYHTDTKAIMKRMVEGKADQKDIDNLIFFLESAKTKKADAYATKLGACKNQEQDTPPVSEDATPVKKLPVDDNHAASDKPNPEPDQIPLSKLCGSTLNPRLQVDCDVADLRANLSKNELIHPIILRRTPQPQDGCEYEVIIGGRRYFALGEIRGKNGVLQRQEYRIVKWDDKKCIQAALSENSQRFDLSPYEEGHFLNHVAMHMGIKTDVELEKLTGISRQSINELRDLDEKYAKLPESWKKALRAPPNCRSSDKSMTLTHYKHIRASLKNEITEPVRNMLDKAATEHWSCAQLKTAVDALAGGKSSPGKPAIPKRNNKSSDGKKPVQTVQPVDEPEVEPVDDREAIMKDLDQVVNKCKQLPALAQIAKRIQDIIEDVRKIKIEKAA